MERAHPVQWDSCRKDKWSTGQLELCPVGKGKPLTPGEGDWVPKKTTLVAE